MQGVAAGRAAERTEGFNRARNGPWARKPSMSSPARRVVELARWAPSGDNTQPWRFEVLSAQRFAVHGQILCEGVYHINGYASHIALGALLQNIVLAAGQEGCLARMYRRAGSSDLAPTIDVLLLTDTGVRPDPLANAIRERSVQRRALSTRPLTPSQKAQLELSLGPELRVVWVEGWPRKWQVAKLLWQNARLRLTMPEAWDVHRRVIDWGKRFSPDRVPDQAIGLDPLTTRLMRWVLASWPRVHFFNRFLAGTILPRLELDLIPALACAAHFALELPKVPSSPEDFQKIGAALQRFWLTATQLGLQLQPETTPLIFHWYVRENRRFSSVPGLWEDAARLEHQLFELLGTSAAQHTGFMGRIGLGAAARSRSLRRPW